MSPIILQKPNANTKVYFYKRFNNISYSPLNRVTTFNDYKFVEVLQVGKYTYNIEFHFLNKIIQIIVSVESKIKINYNRTKNIDN